MITDGHKKIDQAKIANCFNKFFVYIGPKLGSIISETQRKFDEYLNPLQTFLGEAYLDDDELKVTLKGLKPNKSLEYYSIFSNVVK